jgi:peptidylprolyl isomerase
MHIRNEVRILLICLLLVSGFALAAQAGAAKPAASPSPKPSASAPAASPKPKAAAPKAAAASPAPAISPAPGASPAASPAPKASAAPKPAVAASPAPASAQGSAPSASPAPKASAAPAAPGAKTSAGSASKTSGGKLPAAINPAANSNPLFAALPPNAEDGLYVLLETGKGKIVASVDFQRHPLPAIVFCGLAEGSLKSAFRPGKPFYDGLTFFRAEPGVLVQSGSPDGSDTGGPSYTYNMEIDPGTSFSAPGMLAMANSDPLTSGSQFFITQSPAEWLDGQYSVFGQVVSGLEAVRSLAKDDTLDKVTLIRKGKAAEAFKPDQVAFDAAQAGLAERRQKRLDELLSRFLPNAQKAADGRWYQIETPGNGAPPLPGQTVTFNYASSFLTGRVFDANEARTPAAVKLGTGRIIEGLDTSLLEMKPGEKRRTAIPPRLAFGERGYNGGGAENAIPPNAWLIIDIELLTVGN